MSIRFRAETSGFAEYARAIAKTRRNIRAILPRESGDAWDAVTDGAHDRAPVLTGRLAGGITQEVREVPGAVIVDTTSEATYTGAVEYGPNGRPFLRAAFDQFWKRSVDELERELFREIDRVL